MSDILSEWLRVLHDLSRLAASVNGDSTIEHLRRAVSKAIAPMAEPQGVRKAVVLLNERAYDLSFAETAGEGELPERRSEALLKWLEGAAAAGVEACGAEGLERPVRDALGASKTDAVLCAAGTLAGSTYAYVVAVLDDAAAADQLRDVASAIAQHVELPFRLLRERWRADTHDEMVGVVQRACAGEALPDRFYGKVLGTLKEAHGAKCAALFLARNPEKPQDRRVLALRYRIPEGDEPAFVTEGRGVVGKAFVKQDCVVRECRRGGTVEDRALLEKGNYLSAFALSHHLGVLVFSTDEPLSVRSRILLDEQLSRVYLGARWCHAVDSTLELMSQMVDSRDKCTLQHAHQVRHYCQSLLTTLLNRLQNWQDEFELDDSYRKRLVMSLDEASSFCHEAASVHDLGKLFTYLELLWKPSPLEAGDREVTQRHAADGAGVLEDARMFRTGSLVARYHHLPYGAGVRDAYPSLEELIERISEQHGESVSLNEVERRNWYILSQAIHLCDEASAATNPRPYHHNFRPISMDVFFKQVELDLRTAPAERLRDMPRRAGAICPRISGEEIDALEALHTCLPASCPLEKRQKNQCPRRYHPLLAWHLSTCLELQSAWKRISSLYRRTSKAMWSNNNHKTAAPWRFPQP